MSKPLTAEQKATIAFIQVGASKSETFAPHYPTHYADKDGELSECKPDFYIFHEGRHKFFEFKAAPLNKKQCKASCLSALRRQYEWHFKSSAGDMSHSQLSQILWNSRWRSDCLSSAWNHSCRKHLIIQKALGPECYVVVFSVEPSIKDAEYYNEKGLFYITLEQLPVFMGC